MKLIIFGPPGSGKGTYSSVIAPTYKIAKISTGDIFREEIKKGTELGKNVSGFLARGELVPEEIVKEVFRKRISEPDAKNGFILDGFPRTVEQAKFLEGLTEIDAVILLRIPEDVLIEKISARRVCRKCGENYNAANIDRIIGGVRFRFPNVGSKVEGICDKCGGELLQRPDDNPKTIKDRIEVYKKQSEPVVEYYKGKMKFLDITVNGGPDEMAQKILKELEKVKAGK
ncbi:MAG: adenylate kinase [Candidatus Aenigmatarchaeota archaeon]